MLRGQQITKVCDNATYIKVNSIVMNQCDQQDNGEKLFNFCEDVISRFIKHECLTKMTMKTGQQLVETYVQVWKNYLLFSRLLDKMFEYLNRYYLKNQSMKFLGVVCLSRYNELLFKPIKVQLREALLALISKSRNGEVVDKNVMRLCIQSFVDQGMQLAKPVNDGKEVRWVGDKNLALYEEEFESDFLKRTKAEYEAKARIWST